MVLLCFVVIWVCWLVVILICVLVECWCWLVGGFRLVLLLNFWAVGISDGTH